MSHPTGQKTRLRNWVSASFSDFLVSALWYPQGPWARIGNVCSSRWHQTLVCVGLPDLPKLHKAIPSLSLGIPQPLLRDIQLAFLKMSNCLSHLSPLQFWPFCDPSPSRHVAGTVACGSQGLLSSYHLGVAQGSRPASGGHSDGYPELRRGHPGWRGEGWGKCERRGWQGL